MAKNDKFYFENLASSTELAKQAAIYLVDCLENYNPEKLEDMLKAMHEIENSADDRKHEMRDALAKAFVTPIEREDLDMLSHQVDDVVDLIEEVLQKFYIYDVREIDENAIGFAQKIVTSCEMLCKIMEEFNNFKKSKELRPLIVALNDVEEDCDRLYLKSMRSLTQNSKDVDFTIAWRKIYESFEECADACEHVSECIGSVIMKNT